MKETIGRGVYVNYIIVFLVVILDQISKILALKYLAPIGDIPIIEKIFHLTYVENRGAAFGLFQNQILFFIITTVLILGFIWFYAKYNRLGSVMVFGLSLIAGGAIGNLIDRIRLGFVVDYFNAAFINFPVFNIADCAVVIGAILISIYILKYDI